MRGRRYTYARIQSLLSKSGNPTLTDIVNLQALCGDAEWALLKELLQYPSMLRRAAEGREPSLLARYLLDIAKWFNRLYHAGRVLTGEAARRDALLRLCELTGDAIRRGLDLLGLQTPSRI